MGRKKQTTLQKATTVSSTTEDLPAVPFESVQRPQSESRDVDKEQERREQEALARKITALQEFQDSDLLQQDDEHVAQDLTAGLPATAPRNGFVASSVTAVGKGTGKRGRPKGSGSRAASKSSKQTKSKRPHNEPAEEQPDIAIDPNLKEAEGVIHETPVTPVKPRKSRAKTQRANKGNAVLDETGAYVLVPSIQDNGDSVNDSQLLLELSGNRQGQKGKRQQRAQNASESVHDDAVEEVSQHLAAPIVNMQNTSVNGHKPRGRGRPRKNQTPSAIPEKRSAEGDLGEIAGGNAFSEIVSPQRPQKKVKKYPENCTSDGEFYTDGDGSDVDQSEVANTPNPAHALPRMPESGPLHKKEQQVLDMVLEEYREARGMEQSAVNEMIQNTSRTQSDETKELWQLLYCALPQRPHVSVMRAARRRYHNYQVRGKWSPEDDEALRQTNALHPGKWVTIGGILGRMPEDCRDRWRNYLTCGGDRRTDDWSEKEERELRQAVQECADAIRTEAKDRAKEQGHAFREQDWESMVNFGKVSEKMNHTRSRLQCYTHWRVMQKRDGEAPPAKKPTSNSGQPHHRLSRALAKYEKMTPADKYQILNQIIASKPADEESINWKAITRDNAGGRWTTRDRKETWNKLKELINPQPTLNDTLDTLVAWFRNQYTPELLVVEERPDTNTNGDSLQIFEEEALEASPKPTKKQRKAGKAKKQAGTRQRKNQATSADQTLDSEGDEFQSADEMPSNSHRGEDGIPAAEVPSIYSTAHLYGQDMQDLNLARALQGIAQLSQMRAEHPDTLSNERAR